MFFGVIFGYLFTRMLTSRLFWKIVAWIIFFAFLIRFATVITQAFLIGLAVVVAAAIGYGIYRLVLHRKANNEASSARSGSDSDSDSEAAYRQQVDALVPVDEVREVEEYTPRHVPDPRYSPLSGEYRGQR